MGIKNLLARALSIPREWRKSGLYDGSYSNKFPGEEVAEPLSYSPFVRCVNLISDDVARLIVQTLYVEDSDGGEVRTVPTMQKVNRLRRSLDDDITPAFEFWKSVVEDLLMYGNSVMLPVFGGVRNSELVGMKRIAGRSLKWNEAAEIYYGRDADETIGREIRFLESEAVACRWGPRESASRKLSIRPVDKLAEVILTAQNAQRWVCEYFGADYRKLFAVSPKGHRRFSPEGIDNLKKKIGQFVRGEAPLVIGEEADVTQFEAGAVDASTREMLEFMLSETARMFGLPRSLVSGETIGKDVGAVYDTYWRQCLAPTVEKILAPLSLRLLLRGNRSFAVQENWILARGSYTERAQFVNAVRQNTGTPPVISRNEARRTLGYPTKTQEEWRQFDEEEGVSEPEPPAAPEPPEPPAEDIPEEETEEQAE